MRFPLGLFACLLAALSSSTAVAAAQVQSETSPASGSLAHGMRWYHERWSEAVWDTDPRLTQQGGFTFVRIGEFAWSTIEPVEGVKHLARLAPVRAPSFTLQPYGVAVLRKP